MILATALLALAFEAAAPDPAVSESGALREFGTYCMRSKPLWRHSLCGRVILVDPQTRRAVTNTRPAGPDFIRVGEVWTGILPASLSTANTSIEWGGQRWAEVLLPLPSDAADRRVLLSHEAFHRVQPAIGFKTAEGDNAHLDTKEGRILARLEAAALKSALSSRNWRPAARDALRYRAARLTASKDTAEGERALINNEGLAEYTGIVVGAGAARTARATAQLDTASTRASLVRAFGYVVGPAYGLLLDRSRPGWRREAVAGKALPDLLARSFHLVNAREANLTKYHGQQIVAEESARETKLQKRRRELSAALVVGPTVTFRFEKMGIDFNPNNLFALGEHGTVYSGASIVRDNWGRLEVSGDLLLSPAWDSARVAGSVQMSGQVVTGPGWRATLTEGYALRPGSRPGDMVIAKLP